MRAAAVTYGGGERGRQGVRGHFLSDGVVERRRAVRVLRCWSVDGLREGLSYVLECFCDVYCNDMRKLI